MYTIGFYSAVKKSEAMLLAGEKNGTGDLYVKLNKTLKIKYHGSSFLQNID